MIRRLFFDKQIGRRWYFVTSNEYDIYTSNVNNCRNNQFYKYNFNDALNNTIISQTEEIKNINNAVIDLHSRINKLTNTIERNNDKLLSTGSRITNVESDIDFIYSILS